MAVPVGLLAANNLTPSKTINMLARLVLVSSRSVNSLVWALLFIAIFGPGALAGTLAIACLLYTSRHGAVRLEDLADHGGRGQAGHGGQVTAGLGVAGAHQQIGRAHV